MTGFDAVGVLHRAIKPSGQKPRRPAGVWLIAGALFVWLVVTATSGPARVWTTPPPTPSGETAVDPTPSEPVTPTTVEEPGTNWSPPGSGSSRVATMVVLFILGLAALALREFGPPIWMWRPNREERLPRRVADALPEIHQPPVTVDVVAAHAALSGGSVRTAIIRCWMRVQQDAAAVGLPPSVSETSTEYVERVVAQASVDPAPIAELAALYREARFSRHELTDSHRLRAGDALDRVAASLRHASKVKT